MVDTPWSVRFRREREAAWLELERLVQRCERHGYAKLSAENLARLPVLYRAAVSSLGVARASVLDRALLEWLESLVARAHLAVYAPKRGVMAVAAEFVAAGFPRAVRSIRWHVAFAAALLALGGALAFAMVAADMETYWLFVGEAMANGRDPTASTEDLRATLFATADDGAMLAFASHLFAHNSSVGIMTYGLGCAFALPSTLLLLYNGMIVGAMSALFHDRGLAVEWWSWIAPHGVTELLAIVLCGGAALAVGQQIVFPGRRTRLQAFAATGRRMGGVVAGAVCMLALAAVVEGVFRQSVGSIAARYTMAGVFAASWLVYFLAAGRSRA